MLLVNFLLCILLLHMFCSRYCVSWCCSVYCLCVNVFCTTATGFQPSCIYQKNHIIYHNEDTIDSQIITRQGHYLNMLLITGDGILI